VRNGFRHSLGDSAQIAKVRRALQDEIAIHQYSGTIKLTLGPSLPYQPRVFTDFSNAVLRFGLSPEVSVVKPGRVVGTRSSEDAMRIAALQVAASKQDGKATTTELKKRVGQYLILTQGDLAPSKTRPTEALYQQIVGNIVSHRESKKNIFAKGWAIYTGDGIQITDTGRQYLSSLGL
jgi:hypothetical protein